MKGRSGGGALAAHGIVIALCTGIVIPAVSMAQQTPAPSYLPFKSDSFSPRNQGDGPVPGQTPGPAAPSPDQPASDGNVIQMPLPPPDASGPPRAPAEDSGTERGDVTPDADAGKTAPAPPGAQQGKAQTGGWIQMGTATLQALDKINARAFTLSIKTGEVGQFRSLDIGIRGCLVRTPDRPADATAFIVVRDRNNPEVTLFSGWMLRSAPYMSMMAHPLYDIRVTGCAP